MIKTMQPGEPGTKRSVNNFGKHLLLGGFLAAHCNEIFIKISMHLSANVIPVRHVIVTALMAIARTIIIVD